MSMACKAELVDLFTAGTKNVGWLKYRVIVDDQRGPVERVRMEDQAWRALDEQIKSGETAYVEVVYLPNNLSVSMADGQVIEETSKFTRIIAYFGGGFTIFFGLLYFRLFYTFRNNRQQEASA